MNLYELCKAVRDESSLLKFVKALKDERLEEENTGKIDKFGRGKFGWENHEISSFLEAALAWAQDTNFGANQIQTDNNPWRKFAEFLLSGKTHE